MQSRSIIPHPRERNRHSPTPAMQATVVDFEHLERLALSGCPWDERTCTVAAEGGHLACLKWARENGCPRDENTCREAAEVGHLECLKYAHENGCPWDEETCTSAVLCDELECLKYAHENGCPIDAGFLLDNDFDGADVYAYLQTVIIPSRRDGPLKSAMAALDEVKETIPDGIYKRIADGLMHAHRAEKDGRSTR